MSEALQVLNVLLTGAALGFVLRLEHRITRLETLVEVLMGQKA